MCNLPRSYLAEPHKYQLRAYIYQARDLLAADADGFSGKIHRLKWVNVILLYVLWCRSETTRAPIGQNTISSIVNL